MYQNVLIYMGHLRLSILDAGILILVQEVRLLMHVDVCRYLDVLIEHGGLTYVLPLAVHLKLFLADLSYFVNCLWDPYSCLTSICWWGG